MKLTFSVSLDFDSYEISHKFLVRGTDSPSEDENCDFYTRTNKKEEISSRFVTLGNRYVRELTFSVRKIDEKYD